MARMLACPFCREWFIDSEHDTCPDCGVVLAGPHATASDEEDAMPEELRLLPLSYWRAGRGALLLLAALGLLLFFLPWLTLRTPDVMRLSGFELASMRGFWFGGGAVAWGVLIALVLTRRTLCEMQGARAIATLLASVSFWQILLILALSPSSGAKLFGHHFDYGFYASAAVSLIATAVATRLGMTNGKSRTTATNDDRRLH